MAYTLTLDQRLLASGQQENVIVLTDTSSGSSAERAIAIDFTDYYRRIAEAFETMAANSNVIVQKLTSIEDHFNTQGTANNLARSVVNIDDHLDTQGTANNLARSVVNIDDNIDRIRVLGDYVGSGSPTAQGFKTRDANTRLGKIAVATLYKLYVEDGQILVDDNVPVEQQQLAIDKINSLINKVNLEF